MKYVAVFLRNPKEFFRDDRNRKTLILSFFMLLLLIFLIQIARGASRRSQDKVIATDTVIAPLSMTPDTTPTKWWIKFTATPSPKPLEFTAATVQPGSSASDCATWFSSGLKPGIFAYVALMPPLPNRIRSNAGLSHSYLGQIEPGDGLKVINGPVCADGYRWWLIESLKGDLQGWTVEGKTSEQWIVPCPNESVACNQTVTFAIPSAASKDNTKGIRNQNNCDSKKLALGILAQVRQDGLLVIRSEPIVGGIVGRAGPLSVAKILDGPACEGGVVWWKVNVLDADLRGWAAENDLRACPKDSECNLSSR
jgi:hypothetical protein